MSQSASLGCRDGVENCAELCASWEQPRRPSLATSEHPADPLHSPASEQIDVSRPAQLARIEATFEAANRPLAELRHPTKPGLRAVEAFDVLPDNETWATEFAVFRFADPPGRGAGRVSC